MEEEEDEGEEGWTRRRTAEEKMHFCLMHTYVQ